MQKRHAIALTGISIALFAGALAALPSASAAPMAQSYDPSKVFDETFNNYTTALDVTSNMSQKMEFFMDCSHNDADVLSVNQSTGQDLSFHIGIDPLASPTRYEAWLKTPEHFDVVHLSPVGLQAGTDFYLNTTTRIAGPYYLVLTRCVNVDGFYNVTWSSSPTSAIDDGDNRLALATAVTDGLVVTNSVTETTDQADFFKVVASFTPPPSLLIKLTTTGCPGAPPSYSFEFYNSTGVAMETPTPIGGFESNSSCALTTNAYEFPGSGTFYLRLWSMGANWTYSITFSLVYFSPSRPTCQDFTTTCVVTDNTNSSSVANALDYSYEPIHMYKLFVSENDTIWVNASSAQIDIQIRLFNDPTGGLPRLQKGFKNNGFTGAVDTQEFSYRMTAAELANTTGWYFIEVKIVSDLPPNGLYTLRVWLNDRPTALNGTTTTNEDVPIIGFDLYSLFFDLDCKLGDTPDCTPRIALLAAAPSDLNFTLYGGHLLNVTSTANWSGSGCRFFQAWDPKNLTNTAQLCVTVLPVDDIPIVLSPPAQTDRDMTEDTPLSAVLVASWFQDPDGTPLTYSVTGNDNITVNIDQQNGLFNFIPELNFNGNNHIIFTACDQNNSCVSWGVTFHVGPVNDPPVPRGTLPFQTIIEDHVGTVDLNNVNISGVFGPAFTDVDGDPLTYHVSGIDPGLDVTVLGPVLTITPAPNAAGLFFFEVSATDTGGLNSTKSSVRVTVTPVNDPPQIDGFLPLSNPTVSEGESSAFSVVVSDPDAGDTQHYQWFENGVGITNALFASYTVHTEVTDEGNRSIAVMVNITDGNGAFAIKTWTLTILNTNQLPHDINLTALQTTVEQGQAISFSATAVDPDNDVLTYTWYSDKVATPIGNSQTITVTNLPPGVNTISVEVSDGHGKVTATQSVTVTTAKPASEGGFPILIVGLLAVVAVGAAVAVMTMRKRKKKVA